MNGVGESISIVPERHGDGYTIRMEEDKEVAGWSSVPWRENQIGLFFFYIFIGV